MRGPHGSEEDFSDELQFDRNSHDSDGSFCSVDKEEPIGTQVVDYSSLEQIQKHWDNGRGGPRHGPSLGGSSGSAAMGGISNRVRASGAVPTYSEILRTSRQARRPAPFNPGCRIYTNPIDSDEREAPRRHSGRRGQHRGRRSLDGGRHLHFEADDITAEEPVFNPAARVSTGRGGQR